MTQDGFNGIIKQHLLDVLHNIVKEYENSYKLHIKVLTPLLINEFLQYINREDYSDFKNMFNAWLEVDVSKNFMTILNILYEFNKIWEWLDDKHI